MLKMEVWVVRNNCVYQIGKALGCPIMKKDVSGLLYIELKALTFEGSVLCEWVGYMGLAVRRFSKPMEAYRFDKNKYDGTYDNLTILRGTSGRQRDIEPCRRVCFDFIDN